MSFPITWTTTSLSEVCTKIVDGSHNPPKAVENGFPMLSAKNIYKRKVFFDDYRLISKEDFEIENNRTNISSGDVLLTIVGAIGRGAVVNEGLDKFTLQRSVAVLKPFQINPKYLSYALEAPKLQKYLQDNAKGTAQKGIYLKALSAVTIPLAPLNEQRRIADKLDTTLARVDTLNDRLARITPLLKRFRQSVLAAATSGRLTEDWRDGVGEWREVKISDIGVLGRGKSRHRPRNDPALYGGVHPFIQTGDVANAGEYIVSHSQTYSELGLLQSKLWPANTLCITIAANIADTAILSYPACFPDSIVGFVANEKICRVKYVKWLIDSIKDRLEQFAPATAQKNINLAVLEDIKIKLPPLDEQTEIVRRVETLFAFADRLEARLQSAQTAAERLTPALLAKAFRGELVPQDPSDEPAAELLRRLREARAADTASKPKRGRAAKNAAA